MSQPTASYVLGRSGLLIGKAMLTAAIAALAASMIIPFLWMLSTSLKPAGMVFVVPPQWVPDPPRWSNYIEATQRFPFVNNTVNSLKVSILGTFGQLISCSLAAYAFARMRFPGKNVIFMVLLATMMIPGQVTAIPVFIIWNWLKGVNTHWPLILPSWLGGAFGTFLLRQSFMTIPTEYSDAAKIDGAGHTHILTHIYLPMSQPALATLAVFVFMGLWNDFLTPVIYLSSPSKMTLQVGLSYFRQQFYTEWHLLMAGTVISVVPILALYLAAQKYFVQGIALAGLKG